MRQEDAVKKGGKFKYIIDSLHSNKCASMMIERKDKIKRMSLKCYNIYFLCILFISISSTCLFILSIIEHTDNKPSTLQIDHFHQNCNNETKINFTEIKQGESEIVDEEVKAIKELAKNLPYLPVEYLHRHEVVPSDEDELDECRKMPKLWDIETNNKYWQLAETENATFFFYGAYLDNRTESQNPKVRTIAMLDRRSEEIDLKCRIWFENSTFPETLKVASFHPLNFYTNGSHWEHTKALWPYLVTCQPHLRRQDQVPVFVSFSEGSCSKVTNALKVNYFPLRTGRNRGDVGVCVKALNFPAEDYTLRMTEWIELVRILGAAKIFVYVLDVHPNMAKVLKYYEERNFVEIRYVTLAGFEPNEKFLQDFYLKHHREENIQNEVIGLNDCFYRNMYQFKYLTALDMDEIILPFKHDDWPSLIRKKFAGKVKSPSYGFRNVYFFDNLTESFDPETPQYLHMMQHVKRTKVYNRGHDNIKSFQNTDLALSMHNHMHNGCLHKSKRCQCRIVSAKLGHLQHYRPTCAPFLVRSGECERVFFKESVTDDRIHKYKTKVIAGVKAVLAALDLLPAE